jgi:hypothetical protein
VRLELVVAPLSFALPVAVGLVFVELGLRRGLPGYVGLGLVLVAANALFSFLMVRNALRFLRRTRRAPEPPEAPPLG